MISSDCHMHSSISSDSDTPMEDMVKGAIANNLKTICFTEHMDYNFPDCYQYDFQFDPDVYFDTINKLIDKYSDSITILKGVEIGLMKGTEDRYAKLINDYSWDYVIGSLHLIDFVDPYYSEFWHGKNEKDCIRHYFESLYDNIQLCRCFDSLGHLDYILRYAPHKNSEFELIEYSDIIDKILLYIIDNNIALEVNSNGYRSGLNAANPSDDIILRYSKLGGHLYTIGSDAHNTECIAGDFDKVEDIFARFGIHEYVIYKERKPVKVHI